jgi:hypothetical protein
MFPILFSAKPTEATGFDIIAKTITLSDRYKIPVAGSKMKKINYKINNFSKYKVFNSL